LAIIGVVVLYGISEGGAGCACIPWIIGLLFIITCGALIGYAIGGATGAMCGAIAAYVLTFIVYGVWVQRTTGWGKFDWLKS